MNFRGLLGQVRLTKSFAEQSNDLPSSRLAAEHKASACRARGLVAENGGLVPRKKTYLLTNWTTRGILEEFLTSGWTGRGILVRGKGTDNVRVRSGVAELTGMGTTDVAELVWLSAEHKGLLVGEQLGRTGLP